MIGRCTRFVSEWPKALGKTFSIDAEGKLVKGTSGNMSRGRYRVESFADAESLVRLLNSFGTHEALSASLPNDGTEGVIVTEAALPANPGAKARSRQHFTLPDAPGLGIVDVDDARLTLQELFAEVLAAAPALADAAVVGWYSGGSLIFSGDACLSPAKGLRLYILMRSVADWPRTLAALNARFALAGHFRCAVSSSGAILERPLADAAMADKGARLDFAPAGAICTPPLEQRRGPPVVLSLGSGTEPFIDTRAAVPDLTAQEEARYRAAVEQAREAVQAEAEDKRSTWRAEHERKAIAKAATEGAAFDTDSIRTHVRRTLDAALQGQLLADFGLIHVADEGTESAVTVADLLGDRPAWHLKRFLCPLHPEHRDRAPDAIAYLDQPHPILYDLDSHTAFRLVRHQLAVTIVQGERAQAASQIAEHLRHEPDLYLMAGQLITLRPAA